MKKYLRLLTKYRFILFWVLILFLFGYTLFKIQSLSQPKIDRDYLQNQQTNKTTEIKIDEELRDELESLVDTKVDTQPDQLGHPDPFNP